MCKILVIKNKDQRLFYLTNYLKSRNYNVVEVNKESILQRELSKKDVEAIVLPVRGVDENFKVDGTDIKITVENLSLLKGKIIFSGLLNNQFKEQCKTLGINFLTYLSEDVAIKNNYITVEGIIGHLVNSSNKAILNSKTLVIGYGKLGQIISTIFNELQSDVTVVARDPKDITHAKISGFNVFNYNDLIYHIDEYDFVVNTVPAHVINEILLDKMKHKDAYIVDVASKPFGLDHELAKQKNIKSVILPGIPGKIAPLTSGELIAKNIERVLCRGDD